MNLDDALPDLIDGAYAAALDSTRWSDWSWRTTKLLGGISSSFYVLAADGAIQHQSIHHTNMKAVDRYIDEAIYRLDPQIPFVVGLSRSQVFVDTDHLDLADRDATEYVAWQQSNGNLRHYATAAARLGGGTHFAGLSIHRAVADGPTPFHVRNFMDKLLPDLQRALTLGFLHAQKLQAAYWDGLLAKARHRRFGRSRRPLGTHHPGNGKAARRRGRIDHPTRQNDRNAWPRRQQIGGADRPQHHRPRTAGRIVRHPPCVGKTPFYRHCLST